MVFSKFLVEDLFLKPPISLFMSHKLDIGFIGHSKFRIFWVDKYEESMYFY